MEQALPIRPRAAAELPPNPNHNRLMIDGLLLLLGAVGLAIISHRMSRLRTLLAPGDLTALRLGLGLSTTAIAGGVISIAAQLCPARRPPEQLDPVLVDAPTPPPARGTARLPPTAVVNQPAMAAVGEREHTDAFLETRQLVQQAGRDRVEDEQTIAAQAERIEELTALVEAARLREEAAVGEAQPDDAVTRVTNQIGQLVEDRRQAMQAADALRRQVAELTAQLARSGSGDSGTGPPVSTSGAAS